MGRRRCQICATGLAGTMDLARKPAGRSFHARVRVSTPSIRRAGRPTSPERNIWPNLARSGPTFPYGGS